MYGHGEGSMKRLGQASKELLGLTRSVRESNEALGRALDELFRVKDPGMSDQLWDWQYDLEFLYENTGDVLNEILSISNPYKMGHLKKAIRLLRTK
jgi:hypothetical protein